MTCSVREKVEYLVRWIDVCTCPRELRLEKTCPGKLDNLFKMTSLLVNLGSFYLRHSEDVHPSSHFTSTYSHSCCNINPFCISCRVHESFQFRIRPYSIIHTRTIGYSYLGLLARLHHITCGALGRGGNRRIAKYVFTTNCYDSSLNSSLSTETEILILL